VAARLASEQLEVELDRELAAARQRWWREYETGRHPDPDPDDRPTPAPPPPAEPPPTEPAPAEPAPAEPAPAEPAPAEPAPAEPAPGEGWWAAAERALEQARAVQEQAERALAGCASLKWPHLEPE
jgi:hypothetical protein